MTTIAPAVSSQVPELVVYLGSQLTPETMSATSSTFEGGFYASLRAGSAQSSRVVKWIRESAVSRIHEIQTVFNAANALIVVYYANKFVGEIQNRFQFSVVDLTSAWTFDTLSGVLVRGTAFTLPVVLVTGTAFAVGMLFMNRFSKDPAADKIYETQVTISEKMITQQEIAKALHVTKLVLNIGLACMVKNRFWFLAGLVGSGYSLFKNSSTQWLQFSRRFGIQSSTIPEIRGATITYKMLTLEPEASMKDETCAICLENQTDMAFCTNHVFHKHCIEKHVAEKSADFTKDLQIIRCITINNQNWIEKCSYSATVQEQNLPSCPLCRDFPLQNNCDLVIYDQVFKNCNADVTIQRQKDNQSLFEKFHAVYSIAQASVAYLQKYPKLAAGIYTIQQVMLVADILGLLGTAYYLQKRVKEKLNSSVGSLSEAAYPIATILNGFQITDL